MPRGFALLTLILICGGSLRADENWPEFRGPKGDGSSPATQLPATWSESQNIRWKTEIAGKAWSSPVVWDNQIWVTNAPEDGKQLFAVGLDRDTGRILHNVLVFEIEKPAFCHPMNSYASCTPAIEKGRVYVHYGSAGTACLDTATGKVLWTRQDLPCDHFRGAASSPILYKNLVIISYDGFDFQYVVALDKQTGKTVWKKDRDVDFNVADGDMKKAYGTGQIIQVKGHDQLISPFAGFTAAYDPLTGKEIWRVRCGGMNVSARPIYAHGLLYLNTAAGGDKALAVRPDGEGDVTKTHVVWKFGEGVPTRPSYQVVGDWLFMVNDAGIVSCLDAKTAKPIWQHRLGGKFSASPLYADGKIFFASEDGPITVIEPAAEYRELGSNTLEEGCMASPIAVGHALYVRTRKHLYRIEKPDVANSKK